MRDFPGPRGGYLRRSEVRAAPSRPRSPGPRGAPALSPPGPASREEPRWLQPEEGSRAGRRGPAPGAGLPAAGAEPGAREPARIRSGCRLGALAMGRTPPSWQGLSHRDAPAPGLGHCCILTSLGSPGPGAGPHPLPRMRCRMRGGHCLQGSPHRLSLPPPRPQTLELHPAPFSVCIQGP